jgi:tyrosyl-tRNA synthetase
MSSSWGNTINLSDSARDMFGKIMSIPDDLIIVYFIHLTRVPMTEVNQYEQELKSPETNPRDIKLKLALEITKIFNDAAAAEEELEYFKKTFSERQTPNEMPEINVGSDDTVLNILKLCFGENKSTNDIKRLIEQKAVNFDGKVTDDPNQIIEIPDEGSTLKVGKLNWFKIKK